ncbi:glycerophosphoryl diester phosphodiesterase membrane domain-containing protein [Flexivirga caeni]|uniref:DUF7847 domain-containing protein n=1 Tax=Flexivirga caeni TaxID=2294115 RepID=A0A3M9M9C6_9MICO|nr:glycerophosphoryl diester phosphodiesterase membrane domain-containing protein [Flexivirga caeni]RNI22159.1 hypothetical protein EFY87_09250 [Flexivirga caeni]
MTNGWTSPGGDSPGDGRGQPPPPPPPQYGQYAPPPQYGQYAPPPPQYGQYGPPGGYYPPVYQLAPKPGVIPLRPLTLSDIFGGTFATIRGNPGATIGLSAVMALIVAIPSVIITVLLVNSGITVTSDSGVTTNLGSQIGLGVGSLLSGIASVVLGGMLTTVVSEAVLGHRITIGETWRRVRGRLLPLIGLMLLIGLAAGIAAGIVVGIVVLLAVAVSSVAAVIAAIVLGLGLFVAIVWIGLKVSLAAPAVVLERIGPVAALRRSWSLTNGQWWRILGITLLAQLIVYVISQVVSTPVALIAVAMSGTNGLSAGAAVAVQLVSVVVTAFTTPFTAGVTALLYLDQRIRKEALDVTLMEAAGKDATGGR